MSFMEQDWEYEDEEHVSDADDDDRGGGCIWVFILALVTLGIWLTLSIIKGIELHEEFTKHESTQGLFYNWDYLSGVVLKSALSGLGKIAITFALGWSGIMLLAIVFAPMIVQWGNTPSPQQVQTAQPGNPKQAEHREADD